MQDWFFWLKMIFDFIKRLFGLVDEATRKRRAEEAYDDPTTFASPKKHCSGLTSIQGSRLVYADENVDEDIELLEESHYVPLRSKERLNGASCRKRKLGDSMQQQQQPAQRKAFHRNSIAKMNGKDSFKTSSVSLKNTSAASFSPDCKYSSLTRTNQLRDKQEYGQLLQNFLPSRVYVKRDKPERNSKRLSMTEVIDLEKTETPSQQQLPLARGSCNRKSRELFFTPTAPTPLKWYTPRDFTSLEARKAKPRDKEITILGVRKASNERLQDDEVSILGTRKIADERSKKASTSRVIAEDETTEEERRRSTSSVEEVESRRRPSIEEVEPSTSKDVTTASSVKIVSTNTLRDNLAAKAVMKQDFIPRIAGHYNERIEQRKKEAEELKRLTCLMSKHNLLSREAALETQLARSMRFYEAVLDDTAALEDEGLPTLTPPMLQEIKNALVPHPANDVLVEGFGLRVTRKDIHTLVGLNWLNDEVINFYMNLLIARGSSDERFPKVHAMNTFFYPKLLSGGHSSLKRWTRKIDVFAQDLLVVPIHLGIHWCMSIIDFRDKSIRYFDSMGGANPKCLGALRQYLEDESMDKKKKPFDTNDWKLESVRNIPQQMNGSDCGVFSCMFAEFICADRKITFTQEDMPYFRKKMVYEILKAKLL